MLWGNWLLGLTGVPAGVGDWWTYLLGQPGGSTSALDLLSFLARAGTPQDGIWEMLDLGTVFEEAGLLFPPAWHDVWHIVISGLITTFSIMILLSLITWGMGKVIPRLYPIRKDSDKGSDKGGDKKAKTETKQAAAQEETK